MFDRAHPARLAGFLALIGMLLAAHYGGREDLLLALVLVAAADVLRWSWRSAAAARPRCR